MSAPVVENDDVVLRALVLVQVAVAAAVAEGDGAGVVESVKAASDVYSPLAGEVLEINQALVDAPETANSDPYGAAWFFKLKLNNPADLDTLLDAQAYAAEVGA